MNTRMLLTAVLRNRRSQWTLLPKAEAGDADATGDHEQPAAAAQATAKARAKRNVERSPQRVRAL